MKATEVTVGLAESNGSLLRRPPLWRDSLHVTTSPAGWLPVHRDQLRAQRSVTSMGKLYLFTTSAFHKLQWWHFSGVVDRIKITYAKFLQDSVYWNHYSQLIFDWVVKKIQGRALFLVQSVEHVFDHRRGSDTRVDTPKNSEFFWGGKPTLKTGNKNRPKTP